MLPQIDISKIAEDLDLLSDEVQDAYDEGARDQDTEPKTLVDALRETLHALERYQDQPAGSDDLLGGKHMNTLTDHGLDLLGQLAALADGLQLPEQARKIEALALPFACCAARCNAEIASPSLAINAAAALANQLKRPEQLEALYGLMSEVVDAVSPRITVEIASEDPDRPWRVLLLNRAIVATRSHQPRLMEEAFDAVADQLPDDAPRFFREGMGQMETLDYPEQVRTVMTRYYEKWCTPRTLH